MSEIAKRIKHLIKINNTKQIDLARYLGISPSRLSNYLSGKREPSINILKQIALFFGERIAQVVGEVIPEKEEPMNVTTTITENKLSNSFNIRLNGLNDKRTDICSSVLNFPSLFFKKVKEPEKNGRIFLVNYYIPNTNIAKNDYIVCAQCNSTELNNGDTIIYNGRNTKCYTHFNFNSKHTFLDKTNMKLSDSNELDEYNSYYKILYVIKEYPKN